MPRLLLRIPYGPDTDPIETFAFQEITSPPSPTDLRWGNPAFACRALLGTTFPETRQCQISGGNFELTGLPAYSYRTPHERHLQPCAEVLLTEYTIEIIQHNGIIPLISYVNRNQVYTPCTSDQPTRRKPGLSLEHLQSSTHGARLIERYTISGSTTDRPL
jgi:type VI secretion system protein ImpC